jgi:hypothetical protein
MDTYNATKGKEGMTLAHMLYQFKTISFFIFD